MLFVDICDISLYKKMKSSSAQIHPYTSHIPHPTVRQPYNNTTLLSKSLKSSNTIPPSNKAPNRFDRPSSNDLRSVQIPQVSKESNQDEDDDDDEDEDFVMPSQPMPFASADPDHYYTDFVMPSLPIKFTPYKGKA